MLINLRAFTSEEIKQLIKEAETELASRPIEWTESEKIQPFKYARTDENIKNRPIVRFAD